MILITVGSTLFPFQRMTTLVERIAHIRPNKERIIFQYGHTPPHFLDTDVTPLAFIPHDKLMKYMKEARVIICHGGPATIYQALSFGNMPWVLPREKRYGEHLNDHQVDFTSFLAMHLLVHLITPETEISKILSGDHAIRPVKKRNTAIIRFLDTVLTSKR